MNTIPMSQEEKRITQLEKLENASGTHDHNDPQTGESKVEIPKGKFISSFTKSESETVEMVYDPIKQQTQFVYLDEKGATTYTGSYTRNQNEGMLVPYAPTHSLISNKIILFSSEASDYGADSELINEVQEFIHRYVDVSSVFEQIATYYVLLTWVYDNFNELPYLRVIGDYGSGKTRFLQTIGSLCYKATLTSGATTVSPIFRMIDEFRGTMIFDEADFSHSEASGELTKILNSGHAKGTPVIRSEGGDKRNTFEPRAFVVYCPKIIGTRGYFKDRALESRCIVEEMGQRKLRADIPISLPNVFYEDSLVLRNKLLMFRLRYFGKTEVNESLVDRTIEPRLNQIIVPLASLIGDEKLISELKRTVQDYHQQTIVDRGMGFDGQILEAINELYINGTGEPSIGMIKAMFDDKFADDRDDKYLTPRKIGARIRSAFKVHTEKRREGYVIPSSERSKIERAFERYGTIAQNDSATKELSTADVKAVFGEVHEVHNLHNELSEG